MVTLYPGFRARLLCPLWGLVARQQPLRMVVAP